MNLQQCLVATSQRLMDVDVTTSKEEWDTVMRLNLEQTTACVQQGLVRWTVAADAAQSADVMVHTSRSIVATEAGAPLLEHVGPMAQPRLLGHGLRYRDENSVYPRSDVRLRISGDPELPARDFRFSQRDEPWYVGVGLSSFLRWQSPPPPDLPLFLHRSWDYAIDAHAAGQQAPGPDLQYLPQAPDPPQRDAPRP